MKRLLCLFLCVLLCLSLSACGGGKDAIGEAAGETAYDASAQAYDNFNEQESSVEEGAAAPGADADTDGRSIPANSRKLVRFYDFSLETTSYEDFTAWLWDYVDSIGGYAENMSEDSWQEDVRRLSASIRVPVDKLDAFVSELESHCNVRSKNVNVDDITLEYSDTEGYLSSLRTEMERLNELLAQAEDLEQLLMLEDRLSVVRGELESYESRMRSMDNQVEYATVSVNLSEVVEYTEPEPESWWARAVSGIASNFFGVIEFFKELGLFIFVHLPQIGVLLLIAMLVLFLTRKSRAAAKQSRADNKRALAAYKQAQKQAAAQDRDAQK